MKLVKNKYKIQNKEYIELYKNILLIRRFEEKAGSLYGNKLIAGFCHLYIGQEAVCSIINMLKKKDDNVITSYRCHGHTLLSGVSAFEVMSELLGKQTGCSKGKGGSMHMFNKDANFYGGHGIVGAQVPLGTGLALAEKYQNTKNISITYLGDGAANQGQVFEAFNMAALMNLPALYIIENNEYSMGTSVKRSSYVTDLYKKGISFGIDGYQIDGNKLDDIYNICKQAIDFVRKEQRPLILEIKTYRYRGHSMSDPGNYRSKDEIEKYKKNDPIKKVKTILEKEKILSEAKIKEIEANVKDIINKATEDAKAAPFPESKELLTDIYAN